MSRFNKIISKILLEAKQRGNLYHTTSFEALEKILQSNKLISARPIGISVSRSQHIDYPFGDGVLIVLDGNKISERYKVFPFSYRGEDAGEEVIQTNKKLPMHWKTPEHNNVFLSIIRNMENEASEDEFYDNGGVLPNVLDYIKEIRLSKEYYTDEYINKLKALCLKHNKECPPIVLLQDYSKEKADKFFRHDNEYNALNQLKIFNKNDLNDLKNNFSQAGYDLSYELNHLKNENN